MKTFYKFQQDIDEAAALAPAIPKLVGLTKMVTPKAAKFASGALKFGSSIPVGLGIANVLQSKTSNQDKGEEEIKQRKQAEDEEVGKALGMNPGDKLPPVSRVKQNIKSGLEKYKEGLKVAQNPTVAKKYRTDDMKKGESALEYLKRKFGNQIKKQREQYRRERKRNSQDKLP